jgi:hypothetical protein
MVKFEVPVGCKNSQNLSFRMSDPEDVIEQVSVGGIAQYSVCNGNYMIMQVEDAPENNIFGEWH